MRVLAIDPGTVQSAFVLWDGDRVISKGIFENSLMVETIWATNAQVCDKLVIEMIASYGMAVGKTVFDTCVWIGRFFEAGQYNCLDPVLLYRGDVKMHLCQSMRAKDSNIRQAIIDRFGQPGTIKNPNHVYNDGMGEKMSKDKWAAFGVAITWMDRFNYEYTRSIKPT